MSLTDTTIKNAKPSGKPQKLFDSNGLFLFITPAGAKSWRMKYRFQGKEKLLTFGQYPLISLKEARDKTNDAKKLLAGGVDPAADKQAKAEAVANVLTFQQLFDEWYEKNSREWVKDYRDAVKERMQNVLKPLGGRPAAEITPPILLTELRRIEMRGARDQTHRVRGLCSRVFRYGVASGKLERDPAADLVGALVPKNHTPRAAIVKPKEIGKLLRAIDTYPGSEVIKIGLNLLAYTFVRPSELRLAHWQELDFDEKMWTVPVERMKMRRGEHLVPLSRQAIELFTRLKDYSGDNPYGLIFPGFRSLQKPISDATFIAALRSMGYTKEQHCPHGFRSTASTNLNEGFKGMTFEWDWIEKQLAHEKEKKDVRAIYNRAEYLPARIKMMQEWADFLDELKATE